MSKRNTSKSKQRKKRYLRKRLLATSKVVPTVMAVQAAPPVKLYLGKYAAENEEYQQALDSIYQGNVQPIDRYINPRATLIHYCSHCKQQFYAVPKWMLGDVYPHICFSKPLSNSHYAIKSKKRNVVGWAEFQWMVWEDLSHQEIAKKMGVNPTIIKEYFESEGLI